MLEIIYIIIGSTLVSFVVSKIHAQTQLSEGGQIGIELLLQHWFNISPSISSVCIDFLLYIVGFFVLNKKFRLNAIVGTLTYSVSYYIFENLDIVLPFINNILISSIIGGLTLGFGCGLVVRYIGSCGGDDTNALLLNHIFNIPLFYCYYIFDIIVILMSLSYINIKYIPYSLLTSFISSLLIELLAKNSTK